MRSDIRTYILLDLLIRCDMQRIWKKNILVHKGDMEEEYISSLRDWGKLLPMDMLRLVLSSLPLRDLIRSSAVSKAWHSAACEAHQPQLPWLYITKTLQFNSLSSNSFYSFSDDCFYALPPFPDDLTSYGYRSTHEDWLIFADPHGFKPYYLYNPFSTAKVKLPPVPLIHRAGSNVVLSSSPLNPDCVAAFICYDKSTTTTIGVSVICGLQDEWKLIPNEMNSLSLIVFFNGSLYALRYDGTLLTVDTQSSKMTSLIAGPPTPPYPSWLKQRTNMKYSGRRYQLLVLEGQLMMVCFLVGTYWDFVIPFAVFKANFELKRWAMVDSLGGHTIFYRACFLPHGLTAIKRAPKSLDIEGDCFYLIRDFDDLLFRVSEKNMDKCFDYKPAPNIWCKDISSEGKRSSDLYFFLTPKTNFSPVDSLMKRRVDSQLILKDSNVEEDK